MERYYKFSRYVKDKFGCKVYKISVHSGFSCPNRDGTKGTGGCIYCDNKSFTNITENLLPVEEQIKSGIKLARKRKRDTINSAPSFFIYFQSYSNTYDSVSVLKEKYDIIKNFDDVVALSIGTRPDCVNDKILDLINDYTSEYEVWIEYGLQSIHNKTLSKINRCHSYEDFLRAVELTRKRKKINILAHVIIGLPGESEKDIMETAKEIGRLELSGIKIHPLNVVRGTVMETIYKRGDYIPMSFDKYVYLVTKFLEYLHPETVIQRLSADCSVDYLVVPDWLKDKNNILKEIDRKMEEESMYQGRNAKR